MAGHRDDGTFAEDKAHHPNRKVGRASSTGVCSTCASAHSEKTTGNSIGTESLVPVKQLKGWTYQQGACTNCGQHRTLFKTNAETGAPYTKQQLREQYGTWRTDEV